ncbi:MAG: S-layer homology domain-containing protein [Calditrichae bacterium]|nr:S-layer homology domain-containing protein [Calditrichota bacterium]MCB9058818.1 S-layer homology domain-containing protein [Calditrichia bacterium]
MKAYFYKIAILLFTAIFVFQCAGPKERKAESVLDTPEYHYNQGIKFLNNNDLTNAEREFNLAKSLKDDFAPAYEGLALVAIEKGDLKKAEKLIDESMSRDGDWTPAQVAKGRLLLAKEQYEDAVEEFEDAIDDVNDSKTVKDKKTVKKDAYYWMGVAYKRWEKYIDAQTSFQKILEIDNTDTRAMVAIKELAEYQAAVAGQSPELRKIAAQKEITRADVAVLFVTEMPLDKIFRKSSATQSTKFAAPSQGIMGKQEAKPANPDWWATDVKEDHWAKSFIDKALEKGIIEKYPDGTFRPDEKVNRAEFAMLIQHFLVKAFDDRSIETKHFGDTSPFSDVLNTSPVFNAIMVVTTRNIMPAIVDGTFRPLQVVSGAESLNVIRNLKAQF